jgi:glycosyltransferase involved in cell wall biosynthesis
MTKLRPQRPILVVVSPVFNESEVIPRYEREVTQALFCLPETDVRVLFVDDGSSDGTWTIIEELIKSSDRFSAIRLSRNFGSHAALIAGFDFVPENADIVATLAGDLQDPPETIGTFIQHWRRGADIVWGARRSHKERTWRIMGSRLLARLLRRYAMPRNSQFQTGSFFLMDRVVLDCVRLFREQSRVTWALLAWTGFDQVLVPYDRKQRLEGHSKWTFGPMLSTAYDVLIGFSPLPARLFTVFGFGMLICSLIAAVYIIGHWMFFSALPGWTGIMATMTLCFGLVFVMLGVSFEYLFRIFVETKKRPLYFVAQRMGDVRPREIVGGDANTK